MGKAKDRCDFPTCTLKCSPSFLLPVVMLPTNLPNASFMKDYCWVLFPMCDGVQWDGRYRRNQSGLWMEEECPALAFTKTEWGACCIGHLPPLSKLTSSGHIPCSLPLPVKGLGIAYALHLMQPSHTVNLEHPQNNQSAIQLAVSGKSLTPNFF